MGCTALLALIAPALMAKFLGRWRNKGRRNKGRNFRPNNQFKALFLKPDFSFDRVKICIFVILTVWGPHYKMDQQKIERVQRRATKLIEDIKYLSYEERLCNLNMPSLQHRRLRGDMIDTYKIVTGIYDVDK